MGKMTMDKDTILFIDSVNNKALGLDYTYYSNHYNDISPDHKIVNPDYILYKAGDTHDTWIDFQRAVSSKSGNLRTRLAQAFDDLAYRITDLKIIPKTIYYDHAGCIWEISPYDGCSDSTYWIPRSDDMDLRQEYTYTLDESKKHVIITFNKYFDVNNALISINGVFYNYRIMPTGDKISILVPDLVNKLSINKINLTKMSDEELQEKLNELSDKINENQTVLRSLLNKDIEFTLQLQKADELFREEPENKEREIQLEKLKTLFRANNTNVNKYRQIIENYTDEYNKLYNQLKFTYKVIVKVYTWEDVEKQVLTPPRKLLGEWFETNSVVTENCIITYEGVIKDFEVNPVNPHQFRLKDMPLPSLISMNLGKMTIYKFSSKNPEKEIRKCVIRGHNNIHRNTVDFVLPVHRSLIVYEGVDHQYDVVEPSTIVYSTDVNHVDDSATVHSINFTPAG